MLQLNDLTLRPEQKVISAEEYQACLDAQGIIAAARVQAEQVIADAQAEYERQQQAGRNEGLMQGRMEIAEEMVDSVTKTVDYFSGLEQKLVELVTTALKKIIGEMDDRDRIVRVVSRSLAVARTQSKVTVRVSPADVESVQGQLDEISRPYPSIQFIDVVADGRLEQGGCILETDIGVVDASIDVQLQAIQKSLSKSVGSIAQK